MHNDVIDLPGETLDYDRDFYYLVDKTDDLLACFLAWWLIWRLEDRSAALEMLFDCGYDGVPVQGLIEDEIKFILSNLSIEQITNLMNESD